MSKFDPHDYGAKLSLDIATCPMCEMTYDTTKHTLVTCTECGAEGSTACCMPEIKVNGHGNDDVLCQNCEDAD